MTNLQKRLISGPLILAGLLAAAYWLPSVGGCVLLVMIAGLALMEFYHLLDLAGIPSFRVLGVLFSVLLIAATWASSTFNAIGLVGEQELAVMFSLVIAILLRQFPQKYNNQPLATIACTLLGFLYVPFLFNYFTKLAFSWEPVGLLGAVSATGRLLVFYLIAVVKFTDVGAFAVGLVLGRHKLIPRISPAKTWEGFFGGILAGLLVSLVFRWLVDGQFGSVTMHVHDAIGLGILLPVVGTFGDLTESMLKRAANAKDSSALVPGMGGLLDVLDSLLFAVPVLYLYVKIFLAVGP
jgi:phosphatidate cytidylyltransferase